MRYTTAFARLAAGTALTLGMFGLTAAVTPAAQAGTKTATFDYTGGAQSFTVPVGVGSVTIQAWGASGGNGNGGNSGGNGSSIRSTFSVSPGQVLAVYVGGRGGTANGAPGFNGGGAGGSSAGGGGGQSDVRLGGTRLIIAAGGGGAGANQSWPLGNGGTAPTSGNGGDGVNGGEAGLGAYWGGAGGYGPAGSGAPGTFSAGGAGGDDGGQGRGGGGGGAGYLGGGGGGAAGVGGGGGGGGGGSNYASGTNTTNLHGRAGHGQVVFTYFQPQCSDGVDNDGDGRTDFPADPGCANGQDDAEGVGCLDETAVTVCVGLATGPEVERFAVAEPSLDNGPHDVAGYLDNYRFDLPGGGSVVLPCVVLVDGNTTVNPCAQAGGTFTSRVLVLVGLNASSTLATVGLCRAELVATVNGAGVTSLPAYTVC